LILLSAAHRITDLYVYPGRTGDLLNLSLT